MVRALLCRAMVLRNAFGGMLTGIFGFLRSRLSDSSLYRCSVEWADFSPSELAMVNFAESDVLTVNFDDTDLSRTTNILPTKLKRVVG